MAQDYDVVVVGAGLIGASFALLIAAQQPRWRIAVVERAAPLLRPTETNQRVVALGQLATDMLERIGVLSSLDAGACFAYRRMFVWDQHSRGELEFDAQELGLPRLGHMVDSERCNFALQNALRDCANVDVYFNSHINTLNNPSPKLDCAQLQTNHGVFSASLIVAADGAHSTLRRMAKISTNQYRYKQAGIVAKIAPHFAHQDTAWQRFLTTGPVGVLPLANNECSIVWSCDEALSEDLCAMNDAQFCEELAAALDYRLGAVQLLSARQSFTLTSQYANRYYSGRVALLGDAAHSIHPLAGQGANLGFKDMKCMLELFAQAGKSGLDSIKLLARYERLRQSDNRATDRAMSLLNAAFLNTNPVWAAVRGMGMRWVSGSGALKTLLTQHAIGASH